MNGYALAETQLSEVSTMAEVQQQIIRALESTQEDLSVSDLVAEVQRTSQRGTEVRSAVLPLINSKQVQWTPDRKLRLIPRDQIS